MNNNAKYITYLVIHLCALFGLMFDFTSMQDFISINCVLIFWLALEILLKLNSIVEIMLIVTNFFKPNKEGRSFGIRVKTVNKDEIEKVFGELGGTVPEDSEH